MNCSKSLIFVSNRLSSKGEREPRLNEKYLVKPKVSWLTKQMYYQS